MAWVRQYPHRHTNTPQKKPSAGLERNYCRNPDGEKTIWCYTTDSKKRWEYCEPAKQDDKNTEFGFRNNQPFYFRSKMPMERVVEAIGASNLVIKQWTKNRTAQQFFFDPVSKTIKSQQWKGHSIDIHGNGGSSNLGLRGTNSRWF
jgi:hypothetical protein